MVNVHTIAGWIDGKRVVYCADAFYPEDTDAGNASRYGKHTAASLVAMLHARAAQLFETGPQRQAARNCRVESFVIDPTQRTRHAMRRTVGQ